MPGLRRRVFAPRDVISTYKKYNRNQELYMEKIRAAAPGTMTREVIDGLVFEKFRRSVDRRNLQLKMNMAKSLEESEPLADDSQGKMAAIIDQWWNSDAMIGRALRLVANAVTCDVQTRKGIPKEVLICRLEGWGSINPIEMVRNMSRRAKDEFMVFSTKGGKIALKPDAQKYIIGKIGRT